MSQKVDHVVLKLTSIKNLLDKDINFVQILKAKTLKELEYEEMAQRHFELMSKEESIGLSERPYNHPQDHIWRYFVELASKMKGKVTK